MGAINPSSGGGGGSSPTSVTASSALPSRIRPPHAAAAASVKGQVFSTSGRAGPSSCDLASGAQAPANAATRAARQAVVATTLHIRPGVPRLGRSRPVGLFGGRVAALLPVLAGYPALLQLEGSLQGALIIFSGVRTGGQQDGGARQRAAMPVGARKWRQRKGKSSVQGLGWGRDIRGVKCAREGEFSGLGLERVRATVNQRVVPAVRATGHEGE